jgi:phospholipid-binding lipoprotein MlaA
MWVKEAGVVIPSRLLAFSLLGFMTLLAAGCAGRTGTAQSQGLINAKPVAKLVEAETPAPVHLVLQDTTPGKLLVSFARADEPNSRVDFFAGANNPDPRVDPFARTNEYDPREVVEQTPAPAPSAPQDTAPDKVLDSFAGANEPDPGKVVAQIPEPDPLAPQDTAPDEMLDPFARADEGAGEEYDPWEPVNASIFEFNRQFDRFVLKPVAKGYNFLLPDWVQLSISNFVYHLRFPPRLLNNVFQGKFKGAGIEVGRFLVNSTIGGAGLIDVAKDMGLQTPDEDTGQTFGFYGMKPGPYLVLPLLPPFTVRDFIGFIGDIFLNPINWLVAPIIEVNNVPSVIAHENRTTSSIVQISARVEEIVNERSRNLEKYQGVEEATLDLYTAVRNAYLQQRAKAIRE